MNLVSIGKRDGNNEDDNDMAFDEMTENPDQPHVTKDDFQLLKVVGRGAYGKVYQVKHISTNKIYALKSMKKDLIIQTDAVAGV